MKWILVNGIGCVESGARIVFQELVSAAPNDNSYLVICTNETAYGLIGRRCGKFRGNSYLIGLSHSVFGRWLRLPFEIGIALAGATRICDLVLNLSHYGLCIGGNYILYFHNQLLIDKQVTPGWRGGRPNFLKLWMLNSCINRAKLVVLQTRGALDDITAYSRRHKLRLPNLKVLRPALITDRSLSKNREFEFQLFYPTSRFPHKRADLAIEAAKLLHKTWDRIGLIITTTGVMQGLADDSGIKQIGHVGREDIQAWYAGSDALLFTSERETLGLPILEALEHGMPIIVPRLPYAVELLGDAGCYFDDATPMAVAHAVETCIKDIEYWKERVRNRANYIKQDSTTWAEHWDIFLKDR